MVHLFRVFALLTLATLAGQAFAWSNHTVPAYRALEALPELAGGQQVVVEPLENFLRAEEQTLEALLASQEAWASSKLEHYPPRPASLAFTADPVRRDEARRLAFLSALRLAPNSKFALYYQPDPRSNSTGTPLPFSAVSTLPAESNATQRIGGGGLGQR
jgi:hypothetical protein